MSELQSKKKKRERAMKREEKGKKTGKLVKRGIQRNSRQRREAQSSSGSWKPWRRKFLNIPNTAENSGR